jgi:hypothetical protein
MRRWRDLLYVALLASVVIPTLPRLGEMLQIAREMRRLPIEARREKLMPNSYAAIEKIRRDVPPNEPIALVGVSRPSLDEAPFVNFYLYPHPTKVYHHRWAYLIAKEKPKVLVRLGPTPKVMTYLQLRDEDLRSSRVVRDVRLPPQMRARFVIPIVTSTDGPLTVAYTIEGALGAGDEAHVTLKLQPAGIERQLTIRGTRTFYDLVYECFGVMEFAAWVQVSSDKPIGGAFWLVNRRARTAAPIRLIEGPLTKSAPFPVVPKARLWLLNLSDEYTVAYAGTHPALVPARTLMAINATGTVTGRVYAFLSTKEPDGQTRFTWPEDLR